MYAGSNAGSSRTDEVTRTEGARRVRERKPSIHDVRGSSTPSWPGAMGAIARSRDRRIGARRPVGAPIEILRPRAPHPGDAVRSCANQSDQGIAVPALMLAVDPLGSAVTTIFSYVNEIWSANIDVSFGS